MKIMIRIQTRIAPITSSCLNQAPDNANSSLTFGTQAVDSDGQFTGRIEPGAQGRILRDESSLS